MHPQTSHLHIFSVSLAFISGIIDMYHVSTTSQDHPTTLLMHYHEIFT